MRGQSSSAAIPWTEDHLFILLHICAVDSMPCGKAISSVSSPSSSETGEGYLEQAAKEARLLRRRTANSSPVPQLQPETEESEFLSYQQLS